MHQMDSRILSADCDCHGFWRMDRVMVLMQELAGEHAQRIGLGRDSLLARHAVWVLTRHEMALDRYPLIGQTVRGRTFFGKPRLGIYPRYYLVEDLQGRPLARGSSFWTLADLDTRAMVRLPQVEGMMADLGSFPLPLPNPGAADELTDGLERRGEWRIRYTDLDGNGHVNNTRAADWALCFLGETAPMDRTPVRGVKVSYHRELFLDSRVEARFVLREGAFSLRCEAGALAPPERRAVWRRSAPGTGRLIRTAKIRFLSQTH